MFHKRFDCFAKNVIKRHFFESRFMHLFKLHGKSFERIFDILTDFRELLYSARHFVESINDIFSLFFSLFAFTGFDMFDLILHITRLLSTLHSGSPAFVPFAHVFNVSNFHPQLITMNIVYDRLSDN